jgi:hypothetical protein
VEAQFSSDATSPEPIVAWITIVGRPTSVEKEATTTKPRIAAPDDLMLQIEARVPDYVEDEEGQKMCRTTQPR